MSDIGGSVDPDDPFGSAVPSELEIEEGGLTRRPLVSAAGSGYQWELEEIEGPGTARLSVEVGELAPMAPDELPTNALAPLEPALVETDWPGVVGLIRERLSQRSLVVLLSALEPAAVESGLLAVVGQLTNDHQVVLASVRDPEVAELRAGRAGAPAVFDAAAAERGELERAALAVRLRQRGVEIVDALPQDLAPKLADKYLALKATGRL